jgi:hypothetical protein
MVTFVGQWQQREEEKGLEGTIEVTNSVLCTIQK